MEKIFAVRVRRGEEKLVEELSRAALGEALGARFFFPCREERRLVRGRAYRTVRPLFPGYIFALTEDPERLFFALRGLPRFARLIYDGELEFVPLSGDEANCLRLLYMAGVHREDASLFLGLSTVEIAEEGRGAEEDVLIERGHDLPPVRVLSGPLLTLAPLVTRLDFHHRKAILQGKLLGEDGVKLGFVLKKNAPCTGAEKMI